MSFTIDVDVAGLRSLMSSLGDKAEEAARPAAQAAADVLYKQALQNVNALPKRSGNLARSIYQVYSKDNSRKGLATYHVSWNAKKAPHGGLVEFGYLQRYEYYQDEQGRIRPRVRPEMQGKPKPKSNARNRAALDAYYVTLPTPKVVPARSFLRKAMSASPQAMAAAEKVLINYIVKGVATT